MLTIGPTTLIADSEAKLQNLLNVVVVESKQKGLSINRQKSMCVVIWKSSVTPSCNITVNGDKLKQVDQFIYLGSPIDHRMADVTKRSNVELEYQRTFSTA